jgi:8-oxo-dGTP pyrophosphatase MutT (NUDIX family)
MAKTRLAVRGVLLHENQVGIMYVNHHDCYLFPGGALEEDETLEQCLIREMEEETGFIVEVVDHLRQVIYVEEDLTHHNEIYLCEIRGHGVEHKTELEINWGINFTYRTVEQLRLDCETQLQRYPKSMIHQSLCQVVYAVIEELNQRGLVTNGNS